MAAAVAGVLSRPAATAASPARATAGPAGLPPLVLLPLLPLARRVLRRWLLMAWWMQYALLAAQPGGGRNSGAWHGEARGSQPRWTGEPQIQQINGRLFGYQTDFVLFSNPVLRTTQTQFVHVIGCGFCNANIRKVQPMVLPIDRI